MRSKLLLIILFLAIPTAAYADGWILWEMHTISTVGNPFPYGEEDTIIINLSKDAHGFANLVDCQEAANLFLEKHREAHNTLVYHGDIDKGFRYTHTKDPHGLLYIAGSCYPSNFDPRVK